MLSQCSAEGEGLGVSRLGSQPLDDGFDQRIETSRIDLVAVHPKTGSAAQVILNSTAARRNAETVLRTLVEMGLPATRLNMTSVSSATAQANEVRVYVR